MKNESCASASPHSARHRQWRPEQPSHSNHQRNTERTKDSDESDDSEDGLQLSASKKIRPVDTLKLKTPIAFQQVPDLGMIPIRKEGMAVCEKCGAIGVKDTYYTKERRFCSLQCAKSFNESSNDNRAVEKRLPVTNGPTQPAIKTREKNQGQPVEEVHIYSNKKRNQLKGTDGDVYGFDWLEMLSEPGFVAPPLSSFRHAPMSDTWTSDISVGMKVEVENTDTRQSAGIVGASNSDPQSYWVASVVSLSGYKALLRYEGFGEDKSKDFWVNLAGDDIHPVGWCASKGKPLIPPRTIQDKYTEWREFLVRRLTGARSLPYQFHSRVVDACRSRFRTGMTVELIDRSRLSSMKVATVEKIVGRRLKLNYVDAQIPPSESFWCHEDSTLIHPVGWSLLVGHKIQASVSYLDRCQKKLYLPMDATSDLFNESVKSSASSAGKFAPGMKLEAVDPLNLDNICVATVVRVLKNGYLMIQIDRLMDCGADAADPDDESDEERLNSLFCYHCTSACIAPAGFCEANAITLKPPKDYPPGRFRWGDYLRQTKANPAPESLFAKEEREHGLRVGMRVEAADLMDPRLICVATIAQVAGRLVRIHFDGWSDEFDQWMDASSPEIYPIGWCELAGYRLEQPVVPAPPSNKPKGRGKSKSGPKPGRTKGRIAITPSTTPTPSTPTTPVTPAATVPVAEDQLSAGRRPVGRPPGSGVRSTRSSTGRSSIEENPNARSLRSRKRNHSASPSPPPASEPPKKEDVHSGVVSPVNSTKSPAAKRSNHSNGNDSASSNESWNWSHSSASSTILVASMASPVPAAPASSSAAQAPPSGKSIPRLMDMSPALRREALANVSPLDWSPQDVAQFLRVNDCAAYCDAFVDAKVDGKALLSLNKDQVLELSSMKVGPSLKICDLISQLKSRVSSAQLRPSPHPTAR